MAIKDQQCDSDGEDEFHDSEHQDHTDLEEMGVEERNEHAYQDESHDGIDSDSNNSSSDSEDRSNSGTDSENDDLAGYSSESEEEDLNANPHIPSVQPTGLFNSPILNMPLYQGSELSLKDCLLMLLRWQRDNQISLVGFEELLQIYGTVILPQPNLLPTTIHQLHQVIGLNLDTLEEHVCVNDCHIFEKISKTEYEEYLNEKCPHCGETRFERIGKALSPRKRFFRLSIAPQVQDLTKKKGFVESMLRMKEAIESGVSCNESFWGGKLVENLTSDPSFLDDFTEILVLSIGLDGVRCFKHSKYTVWPVGIKIWNLSPEERTSKEYIIITALIPGNNILRFH